MRCDFHLHTHHSDGTLSPAQLHQVLRRAGVTHFAVTDHDTLAGYTALAGTPGIIPGVEVTAGLDGREIHLVGLGIDPAEPGLLSLLEEIRALRLTRLGLLLERLPASVLRGLTLPELCAHPGNIPAHAMGRLHLAKALVQRGGVPSIHAAFAEHLGDELAASHDLPPYPHPTRCCLALRAAGGVAILAHPGIYGTGERVAALLDLGCDGLETAHPNLAPELADELAVLAATRGLLESSGSDLHFLGARRPGEWDLPPQRARALLERLGVRSGSPSSS